MTSDSEECPGQHKCHGCLKWCSYCGDVAWVCDYPQCDEHIRLDEWDSRRNNIIEQLAVLADICWRQELEFVREIDKSARNGLRSLIVNHSQDILDLEKELLEISATINSIQFGMSHGCLMVSRRL
jgi:hypothetical protein